VVFYETIDLNFFEGFVKDGSQGEQTATIRRIYVVWDKKNPNGVPSKLASAVRGEAQPNTT
jgi:hypothetical protein